MAYQILYTPDANGYVTISFSLFDPDQDNISVLNTYVSAINGVDVTPFLPDWLTVSVSNQYLVAGGYKGSMSVRDVYYLIKTDHPTIETGSGYYIVTEYTDGINGTQSVRTKFFNSSFFYDFGHNAFIARANINYGAISRWNQFYIADSYAGGSQAAYQSHFPNYSFSLFYDLDYWGTVNNIELFINGKKEKFHLFQTIFLDGYADDSSVFNVDVSYIGRILSGENIISIYYSTLSSGNLGIRVTYSTIVTPFLTKKVTHSITVSEWGFYNPNRSYFVFHEFHYEMDPLSNDLTVSFYLNNRLIFRDTHTYSEMAPLLYHIAITKDAAYLNSTLIPGDMTQEQIRHIRNRVFHDCYPYIKPATITTISVDGVIIP
ncbi:hypothetical protein Rm378p117 [Rhodothermus phage RM378]|uniref:hypothetical protein n=1 Tax=Rhodothermus phage RM378 TaxID=148943 RepID=UPI000018F675|nr:hypothetical protein Rm378p117 [Rhodothermus phage RM378]